MITVVFNFCPCHNFKCGLIKGRERFRRDAHTAVAATVVIPARGLNGVRSIDASSAAAPDAPRRAKNFRSLSRRLTRFCAAAS